MEFRRSCAFDDLRGIYRQSFDIQGNHYKILITHSQ